MSRFVVSRSLKQLYAERKAMKMFIEQKKLTLTDDATVKQVGELQSDERLLEEINNDIQQAKERIGWDIKEGY